MNNFSKYTKKIIDNKQLALIAIFIIVLITISIALILDDGNNKVLKSENDKKITEQNDKLAKDDKSPADEKLTPESSNEKTQPTESKPIVEAKEPAKPAAVANPKKNSEKVNKINLNDLQKQELDNLYAEVKGINEKIIDKYVSYGHITKEQADALKEKIQKEFTDKKNDQKELLLFKKAGMPPNGPAKKP